MQKSFQGLKTILIVFISFFIIAFLILSGRSFFSIVNYQIKDIYHYFIFEISRPVNLSLINPNNINSWEFYKLNSQQNIVETYLDKITEENKNNVFIPSITSTIPLPTTTTHEAISTQTTNTTRVANTSTTTVYKTTTSSIKKPTITTTITTKPLPSISNFFNIFAYLRSILPVFPIFSNASSTTKVITTTITSEANNTIATTTKPHPIIVSSEENNSWKELIVKYPNKDFVFIPQFNVQAPLLSPKTKNLDLIYKDLRSGVVLFPGTANPGSGYSVILGHSSAYPWDPGDYRSVFSLLNKLNYGDPFFVYYQGQIYAFKVVAKKIFVPLKKDDGITTAQALPPRNKPTVILQSCWPVGVSSKRMAVQGELITEN
ncbi:MAG: sortase [Minisyncoccia bacterium]